MRIQLFLLCSAAILLQAQCIAAAAAPAAGYHYERPSARPQQNSGHYFAPISTVAPLPAVPSLPPLPTARPQTQIQTNTLVQTHPAPKSIATSYLPPSAAQRPPFVQSTDGTRPQYPGQPSLPNLLPSRIYPAPTQPRTTYAPQGPNRVQNPLFPLYSTTTKPPLIGQRYPPTTIASRFGSAGSGPSGPSGLSAPAGPSGFGAPIRPASPSQALPQPLRVPFGKQPVVNYLGTAPDSEFYSVNGRQVKQYAVIEFIDNDIEQQPKPYLAAQTFFDTYRAHVGASGTGAISPLPAASNQINSRANALVLEQQRLSQQSRPRPGDAVALGSGGLGYIRLPNGNVSLGSGSLGYISGQQAAASISEARTRSETLQDALHFGHGPLGILSNNFRFK